MAANPNVVPGQFQDAVQVLQADDPIVFGVTMMSIGFNIDKILYFSVLLGQYKISGLAPVLKKYTGYQRGILTQVQ
jgi:hypothetical protein